MENGHGSLTILDTGEGVAPPIHVAEARKRLGPDEAVSPDGTRLRRLDLNLEPGKCGFEYGPHRVVLAENVGDAQAEQNIAAAVARNLPVFKPSLCRHDGTMVIVGSGPSVADHIDEIRAEQASGKPVMAIKGAHDWLIARGIVPDLAVIMDSQEHIVECVRRKTDETCYLLASKVSPKVFEWLFGQQVVVWHAWMGKGEESLFPPGEHMVGGGSTSGLRGVTLAWLLGFRRVVLFGFDSCLKGERTKRVNGDKTAEKLIPVQAGVDGPMRVCDASMASQAMEFQAVTLDIMRDLKVKVVGDGLFADIMAGRQRLGLNDW